MARLTASERVAQKRVQEAESGLLSESDDDRAHHFPWNDDTRERQQEVSMEMHSQRHVVNLGLN